MDDTNFKKFTLMINVIQKNWLEYFINELKSTHEVYLISPFITKNMVDHLLSNATSSKIKFITRYNLNDFKSKVSSLSALKILIKSGAEIKGIQGLHSKVYTFDNKSTIIGSANFTAGGFFGNFEFGVLSKDSQIVLKSKEYFDSLWCLDKNILTTEKVEEWDELIKKSKPASPQESLPDYGNKASILSNLKPNCYIKFFGKTDVREDLGYTSREEIERSHCHWALTFSGRRGRYGNGRPRKYNDGDVVYMARMLYGGDYAIFGKGIALKHVDNRDVASEDDIEQIDWKEDWPIYIRVHSTEFIDGKMSDCPKMNDLINELKYDSFHSTQRHYLNGKEKINPRDSLRQQADIQLSDIAAEWLENKFQEAKSMTGSVPIDYLSNLYPGNPDLKTILEKY